MNKFLSLIISQFLLTVTVAAQINDTLISLQPDTTVNVPAITQADTAIRKPITDSVSKNPLTTRNNPSLFFTNPDSHAIITLDVLQHHPYFGFGKAPTRPSMKEIKRQHQGKEAIFYFVLFLLLIYGLLKMAFPKYFSDLFRLFFRTGLKQRQIREQLMQTPLPSLLLNVFFVLSAGFYISLVLQHLSINPFQNNWKNFMYASLGLFIIYFIKFAGLKITGWLFDAEEAADSYIFIVFVVNKMLAILLLPFIVLIAFATKEINTISLFVSLCMVGGLLIYRFILTRAAIHNLVKVNPFHFFLYVLAFEIAPLLLVYKALVLFIGLSA